MVEQLEKLRVGAGDAGGPSAVITRRASERLRAGSVWVYRSEVVEVRPTAGQAEFAPGSVVTVLDGRGIPVGSALYSSASQITLRMVSSAPGLDRIGYLAEVEARLDRALALRHELAPLSPGNNACRLVFSEADELPGIVADRYRDIVVVQLLTQGTAQPDVREVLARVIRQQPGVATVVERPDARVRALEDLPFVSGQSLWADREEARLATTFTINGLHFRYDATDGQKTGAFLDQRLNYGAAARYARGRALDICTYQGGFALHLAQSCERVTGVDASRTALEVADANLAGNPGLKGVVDWVEADAFELLRDWAAMGRRFGTIVLDPPAFAKSKRAAEGAARGYREMNLRALKMLEPGGTLVTCSCSQHVSLEEFMGVVARAAADAKRRVQVLEVRAAAPDHPAVLGLAETAYLKCLICRVQ